MEGGFSASTSALTATEAADSGWFWLAIVGIVLGLTCCFSSWCWVQLGCRRKPVIDQAKSLKKAVRAKAAAAVRSRTGNGSETEPGRAVPDTTDEMAKLEEALESRLRSFNLAASFWSKEPQPGGTNLSC